MRLRLADGRLVHLGFCTNVLPGETVEALHDQLLRIAAPVRQQLGVPALGVGLWIAREAAAELAGDEAGRRRLRQRLDDAGLYVFTVNAFPIGGFHAPRVKEKVFLPGWDDPARLAYTTDVARVLADLLPEDVPFGTISTVPLGARGTDREAARRSLMAAAASLARLPRPVRLCLEPEPGAALETIAGAASFLAGCHGPGRAHLGLCVDTAHAAVVGEDAAAALGSLAQGQVSCGKVQISSALVLERPFAEEERAALLAFDEPRFYHQVRTRDGQGAMDLPEALQSLDRRGPWRVHFHVPIHRDRFGFLRTTQDSIAPALRAALSWEPVPHLEVETYTWSVLPEPERPKDDAGLVAGLARELAFARSLVSGGDALRGLGDTAA